MPEGPDAGMTPAPAGCQSSAMDDSSGADGGWYFNVITGKVEHHDRSRGSDLLGPYPDEATASQALEIARERTRKADAEDAAWEGDS